MPNPIILMQQTKLDEVLSFKNVSCISMGQESTPDVTTNSRKARPAVSKRCGALGYTSENVKNYCAYACQYPKTCNLLFPQYQHQLKTICSARWRARGKIPFENKEVQSRNTFNLERLSAFPHFIITSIPCQNHSNQSLAGPKPSLASEFSHQGSIHQTNSILFRENKNKHKSG